MSLLQFILIISSLVIFLFAIDAYQRKKVNFLHFIVFVGGTVVILLFSFNLDLLNRFGRFFGLTRGADLLVYISIIMLGYFYFEILNKLTKDSYNFTRFVSNDALRSQDFEDVTNKISKLDVNSKNGFLFLIRAYNEGKVIGSVIDEIIDAGYSKILVVNDGSIDNTKDLVLEKQQKYDDKLILILNHLVNRGAGSANKTGFDFLKRYWNLLDIAWVVTFDADGQMDVKDMSTFELYIEDGYDILLGSRFVSGGNALNIPFTRRLILWGSKIITYIFGGLWLSDPHNGYRILNFKALQSLDIKSDGMTYASEVVEEIKRNKLNYKEVPVNIRYTEYSLSKGQKNSNAIRILLEIIYKKFFFK